MSVVVVVAVIPRMVVRVIRVIALPVMTTAFALAMVMAIVVLDVVQPWAAIAAAVTVMVRRTCAFEP